MAAASVDDEASRTFRAAAVQMRSGVEVGENVEAALALIAEAVSQGAEYVQTPENTNLLEPHRERHLAQIGTPDACATRDRFCAVAKAHGIWLHIGSMTFRVADDKVANRAVIIGPDGAVRASYDKIHLYDVDLPNGESYRESKLYRPGGEGVLVDLPWARLGVTICYDVRFPHLYRALAGAGADLLAVPASFTKTTGQAHWHTLLRSRAIENGAFVIAAAQGGHHACGRDTFGHSIIIDPWGTVIAEADTEPGVIVAEIDVGRVAEVRQRIPSLQHDRDYTVSPVA